MNQDDLNRAIVVYVGKGFAKAPMPDKARLAHEMGPAFAREAMPHIAALLDEMSAIPVDWQAMDLNAATDHVIAAMQTRHPELSQAALDALDWLYSWVNR